MINSDELKSTGILTKGKYLKSNNYLKWYNYFGISDPCFKFWSLKEDLKSFSEFTEINSGKELESGMTKFLFNERGQFIKQIGKYKERKRIEISYPDFQLSNSYSIRVEKFDNNGEKYGIEIRDFSFAKLVRFRTEYIKQGRRQDIKIEGIRVKELEKKCYLIEDDKNSQKEKIFIDEAGNFTKKIKYYNTNFNESKTVFRYLKDGRMSEVQIESFNKGEKIKYTEKKIFNYSPENRLTSMNVEFRNSDGNRFYNNIYNYEGDRLIDFYQEYDNGQIRRGLKFKYDEQDNLVQIQGEEHVDRFNYQYDEAGNWLRLERNYSSENNKFRHVYKRTYEYKE